MKSVVTKDEDGKEVTNVYPVVLLGEKNYPSDIVDLLNSESKENAAIKDAHLETKISYYKSHIKHDWT